MTNNERLMQNTVTSFLAQDICSGRRIRAFDC